MKINISKRDYNTMLMHCRSGLPNESCGLLAGSVSGEMKTVQKIYLLTNTDHSPEHFSMDPKEQLAAVKDARANGFVLIGNFHSHPASPSRPSEEDKRLAYDPSIDYLILSLQERDNPVLRAFGIDTDKNVTVHEVHFI
ncbi:MAG: M67 family metallopeptidase [Oscillospiraceae bacterium]|jgi:proteasome lid subunit RPN8/RPN11|nr:M67 family metallopeptidase [Oscillospiraceae bacterium]MDD3227752.1 M67 family metallopeptidase [Oscillospiraceae bacterium]